VIVIKRYLRERSMLATELELSDKHFSIVSRQWCN